MFLNKAKTNRKGEVANDLDGERDDDSRRSDVEAPRSEAPKIDHSCR